MDWNMSDIMGEVAKVIGGGTAGVFGGMWGEGWAIMADESLIVVLGEPFELPDNGINP